MIRLLIFVIFAFLFIGIISVIFEYNAQDRSLGSIHLKSDAVEPELISIKEISNISSETNFHFTIAHKVHHRQ